jgi:cytochrome c oxidase subunit IV
MLFGYVILTTALLLSTVAAYYSILGLTAIFAAAVVPVIIMGSALEMGKIVATVFLHRNWSRLGWGFKSYLVPAVLLLMLLTSLGIFGLLSKAHSDQSLVSGDSSSQVAVIDERIRTQRENIDAAKQALKQLDASVDQTMSRTTDERGATRSANLRRSQQKERDQLQNDIAKAQVSIARLNEERAPLAAELRKVEAEVGPIRYIAALVYGDNPDTNILERAVRWVIILIVVVFDPLALCLILAGNRELAWSREAKSATIVTTVPEYEKDDGPLSDVQIDQIKESVKKTRPRSNRPGAYKATTKRPKPVQQDPAPVALGEFVGVAAEPDPDALLEKSKSVAKVTMPTFN